MDDSMLELWNANRSIYIYHEINLSIVVYLFIYPKEICFFLGEKRRNWMDD